MCNTFRRVACASEAAAGSGCFVDLIYFTVTTLRRHRTRFSAITKSRMTKPGLFSSTPARFSPCSCVCYLCITVSANGIVLSNII